VEAGGRYVANVVIGTLFANRTGNILAAFWSSG
jgi:hypothetical protein